MMTKQATTGLLAAFLIIPAGCPEDSEVVDPTSDVTTDSTGADATDTGSDVDDDTAVATSCSGWNMLSTFYPDVALGDLSECTTGQGAFIAGTLMNFDGITITGGSVVGADGTNVGAPCVEVLCDADYAYIASNALPQYDPVADPIFETADTPIVHRIPLVPQAITATTEDTWQQPRGCDSALNMAVTHATPSAPPFSHCFYEDEDGGNSTGDLYITDGVDTVHKIHCYGQTAGLITGIPAFAPCEEARPDPYGSPLFSTWANPEALFVDLCGTHPAAITHSHWINEVCLAQDDENRPLNSYATGAVAFDLNALDVADCAVESDIVGWAYDGHPMKGSCVCMARDASGTCTDIRRARSGYLYAGLARWADEATTLPNADPTTVEASYFGKEMATCTTAADCCEGAGVCRLQCQPLLVEGADGSTVHESRCGTPDYSWCGHEWLERPDPMAETGYVYLDRCNGIETADGYTYVGTSTFPYVNGCFKSEPTAMATDDTFTRLDAGTGPGGPGGPGGPPGQ